MAQLRREEDAPDNLGALSRLTLCELIGRGGTAAILFDLISQIESAGQTQWGDPDHFTEGKALSAAHRLANSPSAAQVCSDDIRFGPLIRFLAVEAQNAGNAAEIIGAVSAACGFLTSRLKHVATLERVIREAESMPLLEELAALSNAAAGEAHGPILRYRLGWDGGPARSLADVGLRVGLTGEWVRQICHAAEEQLMKHRPFAPALDRMLNINQNHVNQHSTLLHATGLENAVRLLGRRR